MRNIIAFIAALALLALGVANAADKTYVISGGGPTGAYTTVICPAIAGKMKERGFSVKCQAGPGSAGNVEGVAAGEYDAALAQRDVFAKMITADPDKAWMLSVGEITPEALFMVVPKGGKLTNFQQLLEGEEKLTIGIAGGEGSGSYATFRNMADALPGLKEAVESGRVTLRPLGKMTPKVAYNYLGSQLDGVFFVMMPDLKNDRIKRVVESGKLTFLPIESEALAKLKTANGQTVYRQAPVPVKGTLSGAANRLKSAWKALTGGAAKDSSDTTVATLTTAATVVVDPAKADGAFVDALTDVVSDPNLLPKGGAAGAAAAWLNKLRQAAGELTK